MGILPEVRTETGLGGHTMKKLVIALAAIAMLTGCVHRKPMAIEYYPDGSIKYIDYRKPAGYVTILGFSLF